MRIAQFTRFEQEFTLQGPSQNPFQEIQLSVEFIAPSKNLHTVDGFWDGGRTWKVRFSPEETGQWHFRTHCLQGHCPGLSDITGSFTSIPYSGKNPLYHHGSVRISSDKRHFIHQDGTPFFYLADTAWNGALLSRKEDWDVYLRDRQDKGFSAIQIVMTQWLASAGNAEGRQAFYGKEKIIIDPVFFRRLDERVNAINEHGMEAVAALLWAATWNRDTLDLNPGTCLPDDQLVLLARYMVARYGAHHVMWLLAGDGDYRGTLAQRWRHIGRQVFQTKSNRLASIHPGGMQWIGEEFREEPWFDFLGYQSGHSSNTQDMAWLVFGPPANDWKAGRPLPFVNIELNYEAHRDWNLDLPFDVRAVRRAAYWSLLISPPVGVTYGAHGIWSWENDHNVPMNHLATGIAQPWFDAMNLPGSVSMKHLKNLFMMLDWCSLIPAPEILAEQPGLDDPRLFIAAARAADNTWLLVYTPEKGDIKFNLEYIRNFTTFLWYNPADGTWQRELEIKSSKFTSPSQGDWILWAGTVPPI
jgi:hypothetical protein